MMKQHWNRLFRRAAFLLCALSAAVFLAAAAAAGDVAVYETKDTPPFTVVQQQGEDGLFRPGDDLGVWKESARQFYLFLPASVDRSEVLIRYDGKSQAYDDRTGELIPAGGTYPVDLSADRVTLYEKDKTYDVYNAYHINIMQGGELATIYIDLVDGDASMLKLNSSQSNIETGVIRVTESDGSLIYEGDLTRMKGHGLTSYSGTRQINTKNSFNINIGDKAELIDGAGKSKKWTILRIRTWGNYDASGLSYVLAFSSYNALVKDRYFNLCSRFVDVYVNGTYWGVYVLTERMDNNGSMNVTDLESKTDMPSNKTTTVNGKGKDDPALAAGISSYSYATRSSVEEGTNITGGYILEIMCGHYGECGFKTKKGMYVNIKNPAYPSQEEVQYIAQYVQEFENALFSETGYNSLGKHYSDYADMRSYAAQTLIYAFYLNWEIYRTSTYMTKDVNGLLTFGPVWDFESGPGVMYDQSLFGTTFSYTEKQQYIWFEQAWKKGDYLHLISEMNEELRGLIDELFTPEDGTTPRRILSFDTLAESIAPSHEMNWLRWSQPNTYWDWANAMRDATQFRYDTWFKTLWNPNKQFLGVTADGVDNGDGTWTLTATVYGESNGSVIWYRIDDDWTKGTQIGTGETITVDEGGRYYCTATGPNNAYLDWASGDVFKKRALTSSSNVVTGLPVKLTQGTITGSKRYNESLTQTGPAAVIEPADVPGQEETVETEAPTAVKATAKLADNAEWIGMAAMVVLTSAAAIALLIAKSNKGGRAREAQ